MRLVYLWIHDYNGGYFHDIGFHFSNELLVDVKVKSVKKETVESYLGQKEIDKIDLELKAEKNEVMKMPTKLYGNNILAINAIVGKNGAGKSSLLYSIMQSDNMTSELTGERKPFLTIYFDEENKKYLIEKYQLELVNISGEIDFDYLSESNLIRKCYVTNVFNWMDLYQARGEMLGNEKMLKNWITPSSLLQNSSDNQRKSFGYRAEDNNYLINIQQYADKELQSELKAYTRKQQKLFLDFFNIAPDKFRRELSILQKYQIGVRRFREDILNIGVYYSFDKNYEARQTNNYFELSEYERYQVETKLQYEILYQKLIRSKYNSSLWHWIYILLLSEIFLAFCGNNQEICDKIKNEIKKTSTIDINIELLDEICPKPEQSNIARTPWCKQIFDCITQLKTHKDKKWLINTDYKYEDENEEGFVLWYTNEIAKKNSFFARNVYLIPQSGSSGEAAFVNLFSYLNESISMIENEGKSKNEKINVLLLIDEIDCYFHPSWQKKAMKYMVDWLNEIYLNCCFQLIITSHSPIFLSDFMEHQVIKLSEENGKCKVEDNKYKTFGGNIAHLYFDSFFMENGQIGEFAKEKINDVIECLYKEQSSKTWNEIKYIIDNIGDEFIRRKLLAQFAMVFERHIAKEFELEDEKKLMEEESELEP